MHSYLFMLIASTTLIPTGADARDIASWATLFSGIALFAKRILQPNVEPIWASVVSAKVRTVVLVIIAGVGPAATTLATATSWKDGLLQAAVAAVMGIVGALGLDHVVPVSGSTKTQAKYEIFQLAKKTIKS